MLALRFEKAARNFPKVSIPANTRRSPDIGSMLTHRLRRWPNIEPTLGECLEFAGRRILTSKGLNADHFSH